MRRRLLPFSLLIFCCFSFVSAQTPKEELAQLAEFLELSDSAKISVADTSVFPATRNIRLYLAFGLDTGVRSNFNKWISQWNRKKAKKYGAVEIVTDIKNSDIILARYTVKENPVTETKSRVVAGTVIDIPTGKPITRPVTQTSSSTLVPVFAYIITPGENGYSVIWRYSAQASFHETTISGKDLWEDFTSLMKTRSK